MEISGHTKVVFTPAKELADAVNAPFEAFTAIEISDDADIDQLFPPEEIQLQFSSEDNSSDQDFEEEAPSTTQFELTQMPQAEENPEAEDSPEADSEVEVVPMPEEAEVEVEAEPEEAETEVEAKTETVAAEKTEAETESEVEEESENEVEPEVTAAEVESESEPEEETEDVSATDSVAESEDTIEDNNKDHDSDASDQVAEEITEEEEEFEAENSKRKTWVRGALIVFGAAVVALFATFIIWYVFATHDFNRFFNRSDATAHAGETAGFVVGKKATDSEKSTPEATVAIDSLSDSIQENELENEVPTAPSDALVYDTISTTRYLTTMAKAHYGNYNLWPYIYQENQAILGHPDRIRPGTPVVIPKLSKYGVDPQNSNDIEKAKKLGVEIYARYGKKI